MTKTYIIAECGIEAKGNVNAAIALIEAARGAGADCVKFQLYSEETAKKVGGCLSEYRIGKIGMKILKEYVSKCNGLDFLLSAFDMESLINCREIGCGAVKIPSPCNENEEMLKYADENFDEVYISSGLYDKHYRPQSCYWLLCTSIYPCPYEYVNLRCLNSYDGLSDHTVGWEVPVAAVALGAQIIEKHFTLSRMNNGPDACCALEPGEFMDMVHRIRNVEKAMGDGIKKIEDGEKGLLWRKKT